MQAQTPVDLRMGTARDATCLVCEVFIIVKRVGNFNIYIPRFFLNIYSAARIKSAWRNRYCVNSSCIIFCTQESRHMSRGEIPQNYAPAPLHGRLLPGCFRRHVFVAVDASQRSVKFTRNF